MCVFSHLKLDLSLISFNTLFVLLLSHYSSYIRACPNLSNPKDSKMSYSCDFSPWITRTDENCTYLYSFTGKKVIKLNAKSHNSMRLAPGQRAKRNVSKQPSLAKIVLFSFGGSWCSCLLLLRGRSVDCMGLATDYSLTRGTHMFRLS